MRAGRSSGFVLLSVALALAVVAALAYLMSYEAGAGVGGVVSERDADEARLVVEAGLSHAIWIANNSNCSGYALPSTAFGAHAYSAAVTPTSGSPVTVAAAGTLDSGISRSLTRDAVAIYEAAISTILQPNPSAGKDTWLYEWKPGWNYGVDDELWVDNRFSDSEAHALLEFDLSSVPAIATVLTATLELHQNAPSSAGGPIEAHRVTSAWTEGVNSGGNGAPNWTERDVGVAWGTLGGDFDATASASAMVPGGVVDWSQWDITSLVAQWLDGTHPNLGLVLVPAAPGTAAQFDSSDHLDPALRPKLTITYACECGTGAAITFTLQPGTAGDDAYTWDGAHAGKNFGISTILKLNNQSAEQYSLLRFDLSSIPVQATVTSATLDLYLEGGNDLSNGVLDLHRATQPWLEGTQDDQATTGGVTYDEYVLGTAWTSAGGDYDPMPIDTVTVPALTAGAVQWVITAPVAQWISGAVANDGFFLRASGGTVDKISFTSGDGASATDWPRLTVNYICPCGAVCPADPPANPNLILATMSDATLGGLSFTDKDLAEYDESSDSATLYLDGAAHGFTQDVDAVHVLTNGHLVLSTVGTATIGGVASENEDLLDYDPVAGTATLLFDGSALFTSGSTDVSAVHVKDNGHLILSNEYSATLGGLAFEPNDLVVYDPMANTATMLLDGSAVGLVGWINAVHQTDDGHLVLSTELPATLGGLSFTEDDLVDYDPVADTATLYFDGARFSAPEDLRAAHIGAGSGVASSCSVQMLTVPVGQNVDDAEERATDGLMFVTDPDLELGEDGVPLYVGLRFAGIAIEQGAQIIDAHVDFTAQETIKVATSLTLRGEAADDALAFSTTAYDISSRATTAASVAWPNVASWTAGNVHTSPDVGSIVQEIVTRPGWVSGNALVLRVEGTGERVAESYDVDASKAPVLRVSYCGDPPVVTGPVAHWKLDDAAGTTALDSASTNHGTLINEPTWAAGTIDGALDFDGSDDRVDVGTFDVDGTGLTLLGWFNADSILETDPRIVSKAAGTGPSDAWWQLSTHSSGAERYLRMRVKASGTTTTLADSSVKLSIGRWYFAAGTYDAASGKMKLYLDGVEIAAAVHVVVGPVDTDPTVSVEVGANGTGERFFDGRLDDVRVYDRPLGGSEIAALAAAGGGGNCIFRDRFDRRAYDNSDGNAAWAGEWLEQGEATNPTAGDIQIDNDIQIDDAGNYQLKVQDDNNKIGRELDLSGGHSAATLRFDYRRAGLESGEYVAVEVYNGATWRELDRFQGAATDGAYTSVSYDITADMAANTRIRFASPPGGMGNGDDVWFDNVEVDAADGTCP